MKPLLLIACTYTIFVLHSALARDLAIAGFAPHLILAGLIVMTVRVSRAQGVLLAASMGLLADCLTEGPLGPNLICCTLVSAVLPQVASKWRDRIPLKLAVTSIPLIGCALLVSPVWHSFAGGRTIDVVVLAINATGSALYTAMLVCVVAWAVQFIVPGATERSTPSSPSVSNNWRMLTE